MYPGFLHWWKEAQRQHGQHGQHGHHAEAGGCGQRRRHGHQQERQGMASHFGPGSEDGGGFGVRRPLRFMAWKLELNEAQVEQLATILDSLKTERAQAAVDQRRSIGVFAEAIASDVFDLDGATTGAGLRVTSAERMKVTVLETLQKTHAMLTAEQRKQLAYLLRSGQLTI